MITVHHLNNSRSQRVLWLLEELGLPYEVQLYRRDQNMRAPVALKRVHPLGKSPVITDGEVVVAESGAIMDYILDRYGEGRLRPPVDSSEYIKYRYWMYYAEGSAMPPLLLQLIFSKLVSAPKPFFVQFVVKKIAAQVNSVFITPNLNVHLDFMDAELKAHSWFAGVQFSAADVMMSFPIEAAWHRADLSTRPALLKFLEVIHARPAYRRALERGGSFEIL